MLIHADTWLHPLDSLDVQPFARTLQEHNGKRGHVSGFDAQRSRYEVRLEDEPQVIHVRPENLTQQCSVKAGVVRCRADVLIQWGTPQISIVPTWLIHGYFMVISCLCHVYVMICHVYFIYFLEGKIWVSKSLQPYFWAPILNQEWFSSIDFGPPFSHPGAWVDQQAGVEWQDWTNCDSLMISKKRFLFLP